MKTTLRINGRILAQTFTWGNGNLSVTLATDLFFAISAMPEYWQRRAIIHALGIVPYEREIELCNQFPSSPLDWVFTEDREFATTTI